MFTFRNVRHFFAKAFQAIVKDTPKVIQAVEGAKPLVEGVTVAAGGAAVLPIEDAAYAALGAIAAALIAGGDASKAKLADAGLDVVAIQKVEAAIASVPQVVAVAKSL